MKRCILILLPLLYSYLLQAQNWPREIGLSNGGKLTVYQPQPEQLDGNKLAARAAVSVRNNSTAEPVFGVMWFDATLGSENSSHMATLQSLTVSNARFSDSVSNDRTNALGRQLENAAPGWKAQLSMEDVRTALQQNKLDGEGLKNDPPKIIYRNKPTTLVTIDGEPRVSRDDNMKMDRVLNSPFLIVKNPSDNRFYLYAGGFWYSATQPAGSYSYVKNLPAAIKQLDDEVKKNENDDNASEEKPTTPTDIVVSTEPAELIQTEGEAAYQSVQGTNLLYANNTLDEIFKDINTQKTYTLLSGRWFSAPNLSGPWTYIASDQLPADFANIPAGSEKDGVLASVAGTDEASEAIMDAQLPQMAKVDRRTATVNVTYDGEPRFSNIDNTRLQVAENASTTVMRTSDGRYFAVDNGIWFVGDGPGGPWQVANERPADVERIPPGSSAYNTKYVYVYDYTPDYVYMGYTPGYLGSYVYGPSVVYGTGWYYRPWYGRYYYPRPVTWGFGFAYNPWTGWNMSFGMSYNFGWYHGWGTPYPYYGGWFCGPTYWRPPHRHWGWNGGYYGGYYGRRTYVVSRPNVRYNRPVRPTTRAATRPAGVRPDFGGGRRASTNIYNRVPGVSTRDINRGNLVRPGGTRPSNPNPGGQVRPGTRPSGQWQGQNGRPLNPVPGNQVRPGTRPPGGSGNQPRPANPGNQVNPGTRPSQGNLPRPVNPGNQTSPTRPLPNNNVPGNSRPGSRPPVNQTRPTPAPQQQRPAVRPPQQPRPANTQRPAPQQQRPPSRPPQQRSTPPPNRSERRGD